MLDLLGAQSDERQLRLAAEVASGLRALTVAGILATALVAWRVLRWWSAVALALLAPAARLAAERLLKLLVARRAPGSLVFQYPSGHVAVATALILSLVLILRPAMARPRVKLSIGLSRS
jgi:membrane-associated phospholipid phosphatase